MTERLGLKSWATGALVLAAVTACSNGGADPGPGPSPTTASSTPTAPSSSTTPVSPSDAAAADATAVVRQYFAVLDSARQDTSVPLSQLGSVMTSVELKTEQHLVKQEREKGLRQTGDTAIAELKVQSVDLDNSDPSVGKVPTVTIDVCWDVSNADLLDQSGQSVVTPSRPARGWTRYAVANYHWSENPSGGWRVASGQDLKRAPCAAS